jgi:hypothetical protein
MSRKFTTFLENLRLAIRHPGRVYFEAEEGDVLAGPAAPTVNLTVLSFGNC